MSNWLTQSNYLMMLLQVLVTLLFVPILSFKMLSSVANNYGVTCYPNATHDVKAWLKKAGKMYLSIVSIALALAAWMVLHAMINGIELLNWDDQSGLMVLFFLAMVPVVVMVLMHRKLFAIFKQHAGSVRSASLRVRIWQDYISLPLLLLIILANILFIGTVMYFVNHPFEGFAGYTNLLGLAVIDTIFIFIIFAVYRDNKTNSHNDPEQRDALKKRAIHINMLILAIAISHISLSMWIQGSGLGAYKILAQSMYFQLILVVTAFAFTLPKSLFTVAK